MRSALAISGAGLLSAGLALWILHFQAEVPLAAQLHVGTSTRHLAAIVMLTDFGGAAIMIPLALVVVGFLLASRQPRAAAWLFLTIASGRVIVEALKHLIGRVRPDTAGHLVAVSSASFPSSHSAGSMLTVMAIVVLLRPQPAIFVLCSCVPLVVGFTRLMLGVHWPSDVLAGWGFALLWIALLLQWQPERRSLSQR